MEKTIIGRGLVAGALAGVFAFAFSKIFLEPVIDRSIGYEDGMSAAHEGMEMAAGGHGHGEAGGELFSRGVQSTVGMGFGVLAFGVAMGALFAVVFAVTYGRFGNLSARALSVVVAGAMLISLWIVPALKYPPNPPATSEAATITQRTLLYLLVVGLSALLMVAAAYLGRQLVPRLGAWNAALVGGASYVVAVAVVMLLLPPINETPGPLRNGDGVIVFPGFPAGDMYQFRLYALGTQVVIWTTIALVFGALITKVLDGERREPSAVAA
ncbi:cobalt transporter [Mycolicibacterium madagascariense]|uniref:Cobalt transporter n=1 Tax=Mycolicibacterium madagascariense TaxID=212765 RepID=A0A7I7XN07_9MYCO|nr:CbtA family protein [Mycolicibacterium madagascariense]MCV7010901.1 CbtA family protein [Mycolicibacterium madagascariense]BBZ30599.1 cobalt transporter [Mycolicibacterium madagascariense]